MTVVISVENLCKKFRIGTADTPSYHRVSELLTGLPAYAWNTTRRLLSKSLNGSSRSTPSPPSGTFLQPDSDPQVIGLESASDFWALKDVSFKVEQGEVVGIVGRNGAGKSTLLKILSRITEPTSGRFGVRGRVASLLEVGIGFHPELTGRENIFVSGITLGMTRAEITKRFDEIVDFSEVAKFLDTPVKRYSSGMLVRLGFAVAAHLQSEILIIDEVLAVGDVGFQKKCLAKMSDSAASGKTVLFVSHNMTAVKGLCQNAVWLSDGTVRSSGQAQNVTAEYLTNSSEQRLYRQWTSFEDAPGSADVRLNRIAITAVGPEKNNLTISVPLRLEIDYWTDRSGLTLHPSIVIQTLEGVCVLNTMPNEACPIIGQPLPKGLFRSVCEIPANLLNDETYVIQLYMIRNRRDCEWRMDNLLSFELSDDSERTGWLGKWIGAVRPKFDWSSQQLDKTVSLSPQ